MRQVVFACDSTNYVHREREYSSGRRNDDYYDGDYRIAPDPYFKVSIEKGHTASTHSMFNLRSGTKLSYRRAWHHIRRDKTDVAILWFVRRGRIAYSDSSGSRLLRSGECGVTRSRSPFLMEWLVDEAATHETFHVLLPTHLFCSYVSDDIPNGRAFSYRDGACRFAERILWSLFEEERNIDPDIAEQAVKNALLTLGRHMSRSQTCTPRQSVSEGRYAEIISCIQKNLTNSDLTLRTVARVCGVSPRHLCNILKSHDTSFTEILWPMRIEKSREWLRAPHMQRKSITEICYLAGFKSIAHFSRMFKKRYAMRPRDFRRHHNGHCSGAATRASISA